MLREGNQPLNPEDKKYISRRQFLEKTLRYTRNVGATIALASSAILLYKDAQVENEVAKAYPEPNHQDYIKAHETLNDDTLFEEHSQERVQWAVQIDNKKKAHDQELARRDDKLNRTWWKIGKYPLLGGGILGAGSAVAYPEVMYSTRNELSRRDLLRFYNSQKSGTDSK